MSTSNENLIMGFVLAKLSSCKYMYREYVEGCYDAAVENYGFSPVENKEEVIDKVIKILKAHAEENK